MVIVLLCLYTVRRIKMIKYYQAVLFYFQIKDDYQGGEANTAQAYIGYSEEDLLKPTQVRP